MAIYRVQLYTSVPCKAVKQITTTMQHAATWQCSNAVAQTDSLIKIDKGIGGIGGMPVSKSLFFQTLNSEVVQQYS